MWVKMTIPRYGCVITHLEPDSLEREVKRALRSITMNKASGGDGLPVELFQILKDAAKVLHSICQQIWKIQQCSQDRKRLVFFPVSRKELPKMFKLPHSCMHFIWWQINAQNSPSQASKVHELKSSRCSS